MNNSSHAMHRLLIIAGLVIILMASCNSKAVPQAIETSSATGSAGDTSASVPAAGGFILVDPAQGVESLSSYEAVLSLEFEGTQNGQTAHWLRTYQMAVGRDGRIWSMDTKDHSQNGKGSRRLIAEINGFKYQKTGQDACEVAPLADAATLSAQRDLSALLPVLTGLEEDDSVSVNGIPSRHYRFDQSALGQEELTTASGEVWVAQESGIVVRYLLTQEGGLDYFGEGVQGRLSWTYDLTNLNKPVNTNLPADCLPPVALAAPLPQDASSVSTSVSSIFYMTSLIPLDILAFYEERLSDEGWELSDGPVGEDEFDIGALMSQFAAEDEDWDEGELDDLAAMMGGEQPAGVQENGGIANFWRNGQTLTLIIIQQDSGYNVHLALNAGQDLQEP